MIIVFSGTCCAVRELSGFSFDKDLDARKITAQILVNIQENLLVDRYYYYASYIKPYDKIIDFLKKEMEAKEIDRFRRHQHYRMKHYPEHYANAEVVTLAIDTSSWEPKLPAMYKEYEEEMKKLQGRK